MLHPGIPSSSAHSGPWGGEEVDHEFLLLSHDEPTLLQRRISSIRVGNGHHFSHPSSMTTINAYTPRKGTWKMHRLDRHVFGDSTVSRSPLRSLLGGTRAGPYDTESIHRRVDRHPPTRVRDDVVCTFQRCMYTYIPKACVLTRFVDRVPCCRRLFLHDSLKIVIRIVNVHAFKIFHVKTVYHNVSFHVNIMVREGWLKKRVWCNDITSYPK